MDTWVHQMIRTRSRRRVAAWGLVLACAVAFLISEHRYIRNFLLGPFPLAQADLDAIDDVEAAPRYFVRVTGSKAIDTGLQQITTRMRKGVETGGSVSASYYPSLDRRGGAQADVSNPASPSLQYAGDASDPAALLSVLRRQRVVSPARLYRHRGPARPRRSDRGPGVAGVEVPARRQRASRSPSFASPISSGDTSGSRSTA